MALFSSKRRQDRRCWKALQHQEGGFQLSLITHDTPSLFCDLVVGGLYEADCSRKVSMRSSAEHNCDPSAELGHPLCNCGFNVIIQTGK